MTRQGNYRLRPISYLRNNVVTDTIATVTIVPRLRRVEQQQGPVVGHVQTASRPPSNSADNVSQVQCPADTIAPVTVVQATQVSAARQRDTVS